MSKRFFLWSIIIITCLLVSFPVWAANESDFWSAYNQGDYNKAGVVAKELSADNPAYYAFAAICYQNASDYEQFRIYDYKFKKLGSPEKLNALFVEEQGIALDDPQFLLFQGLVAMVYPEIQLGDPGAILQKAAAKLWDNPYLNNYLGLNEMNKHNYSLTVQKYLEKSITEKKDYPEPYILLAEVFVQNKQTDKAISVLLNCFVNCPSVPTKAYLNLINLTGSSITSSIQPYGQQMTVSVPDMKEVYRLKVKTSLSKTPAHLNALAEILALKGNTTLARYFLSDTLLTENSVQNYLQMQIANFEGNFEQTVQISKSLLEPNDLDYLKLYETGNVLFYGKDFKSAIAFYERALEKINPDDDEFLIKINTNTGICLYLTQDYQNALGYFEKVLAISPHDVNSLIYSGLSYKELGDKNKALENLTKALALIPDTDWRQEITNIVNQLQSKDQAMQP